jgi:hypothetical protein
MTMNILLSFVAYLQNMFITCLKDHPTSGNYHNPSLGLATKAKACESAGQEWNMGVTFHAPGSVGECEGMNLHTPKWTPTLGVGVPMDFQIFK